MIKLQNLIAEAKTPKSIHVTYIERSGKLYSIRVDGKKTYQDDFKKEFGIDIPYRYDERSLDSIAKEFKKRKVKFTFDDSMDVS